MEQYGLAYQSKSGQTLTVTYQGDDELILPWTVIKKCQKNKAVVYLDRAIFFPQITSDRHVTQMHVILREKSGWEVFIDRAVVAKLR